MIEALSLCEELVAELAKLGDDQSVAAGSFLLGRLQIWFGDSSRAAEAFSRALESARRAGDVALAVNSLEWLALDALWGRMPVPAAIARCEEIKQQGQAEFGRELTSVDCAQGLLLAMVGRIEEGRELIAQARALQAERGYRLEWGGTSLVAGDAERIAGNPEAAEQALREGYQALEALDEVGYLSSVAAHLALALVAQGREEDALEVTAFVERIAAPDDFEPQAYWRAARATALARRGEPERAEQLAREAIELVKDTSWLHVQADAQTALAEALHAADRIEAARSALDQAIACWEEKGNVVWAEQLKARREALGA
jgi:tetratricopeptide (TPR) repeat protein